MTPLDIVIVAIVGAVVVAVMIAAVIRRRQGKVGCCGDCAHFRSPAPDKSPTEANHNTNKCTACNGCCGHCPSARVHASTDQKHPS